MDGIELTGTTEEKDLGVLVDDKLDFGKHIKEIVKKKLTRELASSKEGLTALTRKCS